MFRMTRPVPPPEPHAPSKSPWYIGDDEALYGRIQTAVALLPGWLRRFALAHCFYDDTEGEPSLETYRCNYIVRELFRVKLPPDASRITVERLIEKADAEHTANLEGERGHQPRYYGHRWKIIWARRRPGQTGMGPELAKQIANALREDYGLPPLP